MSKHIAVAFDVKGSRNYPDKMIIFRKLKLICLRLNKRYGKYLAIEFKIKDGDCVVAVLKSFQLGYMVYRDIRRLAWEHDLNLYFGLGFGTFDTKEATTNPDEINGSAIINALSAIDYAKNDKSQKDNHVSFFAYDDSDTVPYKTLNSLVYLIYNEFNGNTEKQRELIKLIEMNRGKKTTYEVLGLKMGYTENAKENISKLLNRANFDLYKSLQRDAMDLLKKIQLMLKGGLDQGE